MECLGFKWLKNYVSITGSRVGLDGKAHSCLVFKKNNELFFIPTTSVKGNGYAGLERFLMKNNDIVISAKNDKVNSHFLSELIRGRDVEVLGSSKYLEASESKILRTISKKLKKNPSDIFVHRENSLKGSVRLSKQKLLLEDIINSIEERIDNNKKKTK